MRSRKGEREGIKERLGRRNRREKQERKRGGKEEEGRGGKRNT